MSCATTILFTLILFFQALQTLGQESGSILNNKYSRNYQLAQTAFDKGDLQTAEFFLDACLEKKPRDQEGLLLRAMCRQQTGQINGAIQDYSLLLQTYPDLAEALYSRGLLFYARRQYGPASKDFKKLLEAPPSETQAVYYKRKTNEQGISGISTINTMEADIYNYLGLCAHQMNRYQQALEYFSEAITRFNGQADFYINRGLTFEATGQISRATEDFSNALKADPDNDIARYNLARIQLDDSRIPPGEIIGTYTEIIESNPGFAEAYFNRGMAYFKSGRFKEALADYNRAVQLDPSSVETWYNRGLVKGQLKNFSGAISDYNRATDLQHNFDKAWHGKGVILTKMKQYQNAISMYDLAIHYNPEYALAYYNRGIAKLYLKKTAEACSDFKTAYQLGINTAKKMIDKKCD